MIKWEERFKTNDEKIDQQHKILFEFFNDLEAVINEGRGKSWIDNSMKFVERYIDIHFGIEEECMHRHHCPLAEKNKFAHEKFKEAFIDFKQKIKTDGYSDQIAIDIHRFFEDWIKDHIINIDTHLMDAQRQK